MPISAGLMCEVWRGHSRRDLDWIILKCLEKDRTRRYETANCPGDGFAPLPAPGTGVGRPAWRRLSYLANLFADIRVPVVAAAVTALALLAAVVGVSLALNEAPESSARRPSWPRSRPPSGPTNWNKVARVQSSLLGELDPERIGYALLQDMTVSAEQAEAEGSLPPAESENLRLALENVVRYIQSDRCCPPNAR